MANETYAYVYSTGSKIADIGNPLTLALASTSNNTITELPNDGDGINGSTEPGEPTDVQGGFLDATADTLEGVTPAGDPIIANLFGDLFVLSNNPSLATTSVTTTGGPYLCCFAPGTGIATPKGEVMVEDLEIGSEVTNADGKTTAVKWIGRQTVSTILSSPKMEPVCIRAGALGRSLPHRDLTVTADHGMLLDGLVINASALVNGNSIDWVPLTDMPDQVTYFQVETEHHDVILANGASAETFVDVVTRAKFDNYQEYVDLYGIERVISEMNRPRISSRRLLPDAIRSRLRITDEPIGFKTPQSA